MASSIRLLVDLTKEYCTASACDNHQVMDAYKGQILPLKKGLSEKERELFVEELAVSLSGRDANKATPNAVRLAQAIIAELR